MFERFTERARQIVVLAQEAARRDNAESINCLHILIGLTAEDESLASQVLESFGIDEDRILTHYSIGWNGPPSAAGQIPFTMTAKRVLELSLREALSLGHNYVGTEHILLGLLQEPGDARNLLECLGKNWAYEIRSEVLRRLSGPTEQTDDVANTNELADIDVEDALNDLIRGFKLWRDKKVEHASWTDDDEAFARWVEASEVGKLL